MMGATATSTLALEVDSQSGSELRFRRIHHAQSISAVYTATVQQHLVPTLESTQLSSIEELLQSAFAAVPSNEARDNTTASPGSLNRNWLVRAQERVARLSREQARAQLSHAVVEAVRDLLSLLYLVDMKPSRIVATAEGGISLWFIRERYRAVLEISNDSPSIAVFAETQNGSEPKISEISLLRSHGELIPALMKIWVSLLA